MMSTSSTENVAIGREGALAAANPLRHLVARRGEHHSVVAAAREAMDLCGIGELAGVHASALSTGHRRLVELARALAGRFTVLLLDEPSAGLDAAETKGFAAILRRVVRERGIGVLLVEHDMRLVMDLCDHIHVLDFGKPLYAGTPLEVAASAIVREAYLGGEIHDVA